MDNARHFGGARSVNAMRFLFALLYAMVGALLLYINFTSGAAGPMQGRLILGLEALLCFLRRVAGRVGRRPGVAHRPFDLRLAVVDACVLLRRFGLLTFPDKSSFLPSMVVLIVAGILTLPALGCVLSLIA
jgi:hypothetical protein